MDRMFELFGPGLSRKPKSQLLPIVLLATILHVGVFAALIVHGQQPATEEPEPMIHVTFAQIAISAPPPPAAGQPEAPKTTAPAPIEPIETPQVIEEPIVETTVFEFDDIPDPELIAPTLVPLDAQDLSSLPGVRPSGSASATRGLPGGTGSATENLTGPFTVGGGISNPEIIHLEELEYPNLARAANRQGRVILKAVIDPDGSVREVEVIQGLNMGCTEAAVDNLKKRTYKPALKNGVPVACYLKVIVDFVLSEVED